MFLKIKCSISKGNDLGMFHLQYIPHLKISNIHHILMKLESSYVLAR